MVTLSDCSHMEIKKIYNCDIVKIEKKAVCRIDKRFAKEKKQSKSSPVQTIG